MSNPTYLPLLNSIAVNESKGEKLLNAWANATDDSQLAEVLSFVAIREGEHAWAFTKRLCELGEAVCEETAFQFFDDFDGLLACVCSDASDAEKIASFPGAGERDSEGPDPFAGFFNDQSIDPTTGALLGRYIAEERDSGRRLAAQYKRIWDSNRSGHAPSEEIEALKVCVATLQSELEDLKRVRNIA